MKSIIFTLALMLPMAVNAQREYRYLCDDDVYLMDDEKVVVYDRNYDEVVDEKIDTKNVLVRHNRVTNYYHEDVVSENHYILNGSPTIRKYRRVYESPSYYYYERPSYSYVGRGGSYRYKCVERWYFFFDLGSSRLINREEMAYLIDYALSHPYMNLYIDSYSDVDTGSRKLNMKLSKDRGDAIAEILVREGVNRNRILIINHGCDKQIYYTNDYNRCVTVTASRR